MSDITPRKRYDAKCPRITIRLLGLQSEVEARTPEHGSASESIRRDLKRYYSLMREEVLTIGLDKNEVCAVMDACNGLFVDDYPPLSVTYIWAEVADAIQMDGLADKWEIDGDALIAKLRGMTRAQAFALADCITRYWSHCERSIEDLLQEIGLMSKEDK